MTRGANDREDEVRTSFASQGLMRLIDARIVELGDGICTLEAPFAARLGQQEGFFHGGIIGALGDVAGGYAAMMALPAESEVVTLEYKVNFLRPALGALLHARAQVLRAGRTIAVTRCEVMAGDPGRMTLCAALQQSIAVSRSAMKPS